jgi:hypothetical protein
MTKYFNKDGVEFKVGDKVKVVNTNSERENGMGPGMKWGNSWNEEMPKNVGKVFTIQSLDYTGVYFEGVRYGYPLTALENLSYKESQEIEVGDLVEIICDQGSSAYRGKVGTTGIVVCIEDIQYPSSDHIVVLEDFDGCGQYRRRFKLVTKAKDIVKVQATPELKPFQRVKLRNGKVGIVFNDTKLSFEDNTWTAVRFDSATSWDAEWVITTIYDAPRAAYALDITAYGDIIWESEEFKAEIETKIKQEKIAEATAQVDEAKAVFDKASVALREAQAALEAVE